MQVADQELAAAAGKQRPGRNAFGRYLGWLLLLPAVFYLTGFLLVRMPGYERWGGSAWGPILDYAFQAGGQDADIVIFGDSSALFAVDPIMMSKQVGMKVINLPNTIGGLPVIGDMALRRYLSTNRPPRLIVFYFCSWDLDYGEVKGTRLFEGEEMLARHGSWRQIADFGLHRPREVFYFPFRVYSGFGPVAILRALRHPKAVPEVAAFRGHVANDLPFAALPQDCALPAADIGERHSTSVRNLMVSYSTTDTRTMLYLAPVPGCVNVQQLLLPDGVAVAPPAVFSPSEFTADTYYAHLKPNAVGAATTLLSSAIRAQLRR